MITSPPPPLRIGHCTPESLAMLGPLLCLYRAVESHVLSGLSWATGVCPTVSIDSDGTREALTFFDAGCQPCWQLFLLPDSDFLAWEEVVAGLGEPAATMATPLRMRSGWHSIRRAVGNPIWRACALQLHAVPRPDGPCCLAAADVTLSEVGRRQAERIARAAGACLPVAGPPLHFPFD